MLTGNELANAVVGEVVRLALTCFVLGGFVFLLLRWIVVWLVAHVSIQ